MEEWAGKDQSLIQGSGAWKTARSKRLGGSEIASVLGLSPYKTRLQLWEEKTGRRAQPEISHLPHVRRGIDAEPIARSYLEDIMGVKYTTPVLRHKGYEWMAASLDGLASDHILEIKTMSKEKHQDVARGDIPDYYRCQLDWGCFISGKARALFASIRPEEINPMKKLYWTWIESSVKEQERLVKEAIIFWKHVEEDTRPESYELELDL